MKEPQKKQDSLMRIIETLTVFVCFSVVDRVVELQFGSTAEGNYATRLIWCIIPEFTTKSLSLG